MAGGFTRDGAVQEQIEASLEDKIKRARIWTGDADIPWATALDGANPNGWVPEEKVTVDQALIAYTRNGAYAAFDAGQSSKKPRI